MAAQGGGRSVQIWLTLCSCLLLFLLAVSLHPEVLTCLYILPSVMFLCSRKQSVTGTASHRCRQGMSQRCCFRYSLVIILITVLIQTEIAVIKEQDYPTFCACRSIIIPWFRVGAHDYHEHGMQHEESVSSNDCRLQPCTHDGLGERHEYRTPPPTTNHFDQQ